MKIDVVIPIYNAYSALKNCLQSLEIHHQNVNDVLLINDASTDQRISPMINQFALRNKWDVIESFENKGFVKTANLGLIESSENTILLNSDTIVTKYWDEALMKALESDEKIGTITSWSNNAEICSFPEFLKNNSRPIELDEFSEALFKMWQPEYPEIPTAVGFCMLVSKKAKEKVGLFDEKQFGHGYGEENDYSIRVKEQGLKNILCDNAYVVHLGNESFADLGLMPNKETMKKLLIKHPNYLEMIKKYIEKDPLSNIRKEIKEKLNISKFKLNK